MGSASTKFRKHLQNGDEYAALQIFKSTPELRHSLDPNYSYGDSLSHNTPIHLAAKHAMKPLLRIFLSELGGNPNKCNAAKETALHLACQGNYIRSPSTQDRRAACVSLILYWKGSATDENGERESMNLDAADDNGNTALHFAAETGLMKCCILLVSNGANIFAENKDKETACEIAEKNGHFEIAQYLEAKMVFAGDDSSHEQELVISGNLKESNGLSPQDLQEAKDQLLVETSDMLHVPLFTSEALLRNYDWSREALLEAWMDDPLKCCELAGVQAPTSALQYQRSVEGLTLPLTCDKVQDEYQNESLNSPVRVVPPEPEAICEICINVITGDEELICAPCQHRFCRSCWKSYLTTKIQNGDAHNIICPSFDCIQLVPANIIESLVSSDVARRYLQFDIEAFVESNPAIKWCPNPGCSQAVRLSEDNVPFPQEFVHLPSSSPPAPVSHAVDCGNGHYFCWECLGEAHSPCGCEQWNEWQKKIEEVNPEELRNTYSKTEDAANCLWLVTNSKPCPNCKSPIQKNEGCNHMKCSKCKYDFCWVCLETWKKHGSATGGYFRCNRFEAVNRAEENAGLLISEAEVKNKEMQELKRFVHYFTRFKNHENSLKLESPLLNTANDKITRLAASVNGTLSPDIEITFLQDSVQELLRSRRALRGSYVYGYYLEDNGYNKTIFEFMQNDLEEATEQLSEMVARQCLKSPRTKILQATSRARRKRQEFVVAVSKGLIPPETPPSMRRGRRKQYPSVMGIDPVEDDQLNQAIINSLQDLDPNNPWVKDSNGRHTNLSAIYDWPDYDSDEEDGTTLTASLLGVCSREGCTRPRARNPRTEEIHEFCCLRCKHLQKLGREPSEEYETDSSMDLEIALEMSRLQMREDERRARKQEEEDSMRVALEEDPPKEIESTSSLAAKELGQKETTSKDTFDYAEYGLKLAENANPNARAAISFFMKETNMNQDLNSLNFNTGAEITKSEKQLFNFESACVSSGD